MKTPRAFRIEPYLLNLAGEYRVCSELAKRGLLPCLTFGNYKGADIYVVGARGQWALRIEVKASQKRHFVTAMHKKYSGNSAPRPDFWVLCSITRSGEGAFSDRFFVLSHRELARIQRARTRRYRRRYRERHGRDFDQSRGVDRVGIDDVKEHEGAWGKIGAAIEASQRREGPPLRR